MLLHVLFYVFTLLLFKELDKLVAMTATALKEDFVIYNSFVNVKSNYFLLKTIWRVQVHVRKTLFF